jgi:hypothetical protein
MSGWNTALMPIARMAKVWVSIAFLINADAVAPTDEREWKGGPESALNRGSLPQVPLVSAHSRLSIIHDWCKMKILEVCVFLL